ncbi:hypothetical protein FA15DRAFT_671093 [Coprinopsis marcescibilis]|uniref:DUF4484 domain-containing protein n=1 Tax=Coprinopsis marcescibilis TaxID=230819 RepID=A0A5C3KR24_COPMA|nr:hypothetical protein FA15DRAFT_671093 [Coprinopsis marcescibilis]
MTAPKDIAAIFHVSFHPTKGNTVDWCFKAPEWEELQIDGLGLEFSALPSGLHQVDEDVVYFTSSIPTATATNAHQTLHALSLFRRRRTPNPIYRGFLLSALGVLVVPSYPDGATTSDKGGTSKPRPWRHLDGLLEVAERCYSRPGSDPSALPLLVDFEGSSDAQWYMPAQNFLSERGVTSPSLHDYVSQVPTSTSIDEDSDDELRSSHDLYDELAGSSNGSPPTLRLPSILSLLGASSITLFKQLIARKRVLIYTNPPVQQACEMCYAVVDMVRGVQSAANGGLVDDLVQEGVTFPPRHTLPVQVFGMLTLNDLINQDKLSLVEDREKTGTGWVACTTDALFLEKPQYYDLLIDLTALSSYSSSAYSSHYPSNQAGPTGTKKPPNVNLLSNRPRPTFYLSKPASSNSSKQSNKLSLTRWAWSDVRLWGEVDRVLRVVAIGEGGEVQEKSKTLVPSPSSSSSSSTSAPIERSVSAPASTSSRQPLISKKEKAKGKGKVKGKDKGKHKSLDAGVSSLSHHHASHPYTLPSTPSPSLGISSFAIPTTLADAWKVYEDVCLVCAGVWMGALSARAGAGGASLGVPGAFEDMSLDLPLCSCSRSLVAKDLEQDSDDNLPHDHDHDHTASSLPKKQRDVSWSNASAETATRSGPTKTLAAPSVNLPSSASISASASATEEEDDHHNRIDLELRVSVTVAILDLLERYAQWQIGVLRAYARSLIGGGEDLRSGGKLTLVLNPRDLVLLDLNPLSTGDIKYLEALLAEYAGCIRLRTDRGSASRSRVEGSTDVSVELVVKRGWKDLVGVVLGFV